MEKHLLDSQVEKEITDNFHKLYYDSFNIGKTWADTYWFGVKTQKCPLDMWIYQEMLYKNKPDLIIETGTAYGGSALYMANICDLIGKGRIVTVDIQYRKRPEHERITYILGSSIAPDIVSQVKAHIKPDETVMVILDSDHSRAHVIEEMRIYHKLVSMDNYMIVEDSNINGYPVLPGFGPGPMEAIDEFLAENNDFIIDKSQEKFYLTFNPRGFLKKVK